ARRGVRGRRRRCSAGAPSPDRRAAFHAGHCGAGPGRHRRARLCLVERGWAAAVRAAIGGHRAEKRAARGSAGGDRAATGRARRAEERRQGAHGNSASGGPHHRGDEGGRGRLATPCSAPVLVLGPGDVGLGHRKATAIGRHRAAAPPSGGRSFRIARSAQTRGRCASIARGSPVADRAGVAIFAPWRRGRKGWTKMPIIAENLVRLLQMTGAALAIPAAAAGTFAAHQSYFSSDVTCQKLRSNVIAIMERNIAPETKRSLIKKDATEFDKLCGEGDPDARAIFQAAMSEHPGDAAHSPTAAASAHADSSPQRQQTAALGVFGAPGSREHYGWVVALSRRLAGSWMPHFNGYTISDSSLPPPGTILSAKMMLPVWSEPQVGTNDPTKLQSRLPTGACVRVLSTRGGTGRLWAEVAPASCS